MKYINKYINHIHIRKVILTGIILFFALLLCKKTLDFLDRTLPPYWDILWNHPDHSNVQMLYEKNMLRDKKHRKFHPEAPAVLDDILSMLCRYYGLDDVHTESGQKQPDQKNWFAPDRAFAVYNGWCTESDAERGQDFLSGAQAIQMINHALFSDFSENSGGSLTVQNASEQSDRLDIPDWLDGLNAADLLALYTSETLTRGEAVALTCQAVRYREKDAPPEGESIQVPILMYHDISYLGYGYSMTPEVFRKQIQELLNAGFHTVFYSQLIEYVNQNTALPERPFVLTLDDGYASNYEYVWPILQEFNIKAEISLVGAAVQYADWGLTWEQIREMSESGLVRFQSHTYAMHEDYRDSGGRNGSLKRNDESWSEYLQAIAEDQTLICDKIETCTGIRPVAFTYPMGRWNTAADALLYTLDIPISVITWDAIPRITQGDPSSLRRLNRLGMDFIQETDSVIDLLLSYKYQDETLSRRHFKWNAIRKSIVGYTGIAR